MKLILGAIAIALVIVLIVRDKIEPTSPAAERRDTAVAVTAREVGATPIERRVAYVEPEQRSVLTVAPAEMIDVVRATRRVRPDRRVLLAVADIHRLLAGGPSERVYATWRDPNWVIDYGERHIVVGTLPELASLTHARALLGGWISAIQRSPGHTLNAAELEAAEQSTRSAVDSLSAPAVFNAIARLDELWNKSRDPRLLPLAADAFATLALMSDDHVDMSDALLGRALALTVAARAFDNRVARRSDVLVASALGYSAEARDSARALETNDPVRQFALGQDTLLMTAADASDAEPLTQYFAIIRAGERGQEAWYSAIRRFGMSRRSSTATLKTAFVSGDFDLERGMPYNAPAAVTSELRAIAATKNLRARMSDRIRTLFGNVVAAGFTGARGDLARASGLTDLEIQLRETSSKFSGTMIDSSVVDGYFRSFYYSALGRAAEFNLDRLSSVAGSRRLADDMTGELPPGPAPEYAGWLHHLADAKAGKRVTLDLIRDVRATRWLGYRQLQMTIDEIERDRRYEAYDEQASAALALAARLDGRPSHVHARARLSSGTTWDMVGAERFYRRAAAMRGGADESLEAWVARLVRDTTALMQMVTDTTAPLSARAEAVQQLARDSLAPEPFLRAQFEAFIAKHPERWRPRSAYIEFLRRIGDDTTAESVAKEWVEKYQGSATNFFDPANARVALSRALDNQKRYAEAWDAIEPATGSYQGNAMDQALSVLVHLGRLDDAAELSDRILDRYPDATSSHTTRALVLWKQKKLSDAAKQLHDAGGWVNENQWRSEVPRVFLDALGDQPDSVAMAAFQAMVAAGIPNLKMSEFATGLARRKRPDLAFAFHSRLQPITSMRGVGIPVEAAKALRQWRGDAAATEWLRSTLRGGIEGTPAMVFYQERAFDELWTLRAPAQRETPFTWLLRAAAVASSSTVARRQRDEVLAYFRSPGSDPYFVMGRYLMGLTSQDEVLRLADSPKRRCEVAYYVGIRAKADGRMDDASDWFFASVATGQEREAEYYWSQREINRFATAGMSLAAQRR